MPEGFEAFVPNPLPPQLQWTPKMVHALSDADRAIGRLAGEGRRLPNPHVLMRPFIAREAVLSSRIEGTLATLGELLAAEAGAVVDRSPDDIREVANYVVALEYGMQQLRNQPLSIHLLQEIHEKLLQGVRGELARPGKIRDAQNWIGVPGSTPHTASYVPPPPSELTGLLHSLEAFLADTSLPPLVQIALTHYQFEAIHPFLDGNGRVGRLLVTLFLIQRAILPTPLLYLSAFFEATRSEYITRLHAVTTESDWENWLLYFVNGVARQSEDAEDRASRIINILDVWRLRVAGLGSETPAHVLELLAGNPFVTARLVSEQLSVARSTASRAIDHLIELVIVVQTDDRNRDRAYCAQELLDIMNEPARINPM
ncbi:Fic family protein [Candidatus Bipolaricaulota bacterium]|nr:Fic family protein [Candidatus Bipolaricaulota bacterium]